MSYLAPPPMPAPVIVMKDVGGFVTDYQNQTEIYRASRREVRLHECRSACTLALSLPNVCVYPDSRLKFHLAYDPRNHQTNADVSQQLFNSYPAAVRARLGTLTREYKVLSGSELIALGIRDCTAPKTIEPVPGEPKVMVASAAARKTPAAAAKAEQSQPLFAGLMDKMLSVLGASGTAQTAPNQTAPSQAAAGPPRSAQSPAPAPVELANIPLPPPRPPEYTQTAGMAAAVPVTAPDNGETEQAAAIAVAQASGGGPGQPGPQDLVPRPPQRPNESALSAGRRPQTGLPKLITGSQPILPPDFSAYAEMDPY